MRNRAESSRVASLRLPIQPKIQLITADDAATEQEPTSDAALELAHRLVAIAEAEAGLMMTHVATITRRLRATAAASSPDQLADAAESAAECLDQVAHRAAARFVEQGRFEGLEARLERHVSTEELDQLRSDAVRLGDEANEALAQACRVADELITATSRAAADIRSGVAKETARTIFESRAEAERLIREAEETAQMIVDDAKDAAAAMIGDPGQEPRAVDENDDQRAIDAATQRHPAGARRWKLPDTEIDPIDNEPTTDDPMILFGETLTDTPRRLAEKRNEEADPAFLPLAEAPHPERSGADAAPATGTDGA